MLLPPLKRDQQNCQINDDYYMVNMDTFNVLPRRFYREHSFESVYRHDSGRFYREHSFESVTVMILDDFTGSTILNQFTVMILDHFTGSTILQGHYLPPRLSNQPGGHYLSPGHPAWGSSR